MLAVCAMDGTGLAGKKGSVLSYHPCVYTAVAHSTPVAPGRAAGVFAAGGNVAVFLRAAQRALRSCVHTFQTFDYWYWTGPDN